MYGARYVRIMAGDPGFKFKLPKIKIPKFAKSIVGTVAKPLAAISKIPVVGSLARAIPGVGTALSVASLAGPAFQAAKGGLSAARAALGGSKITTGALKLGGKTLLGGGGPSRPGIGQMVGMGLAAGAGVATGIGASTVKRRSSKPKTQPMPAPRRSRRRAATMKRTRCGCPKGKRHVCFSTGRRSKGSRGASAAQIRARKRFAAAARRGPIRKGASL